MRRHVGQLGNFEDFRTAQENAESAQVQISFSLYENKVLQLTLAGASFVSK